MLSFDQLKEFFPQHLHVFGKNIVREYLQHIILRIVFQSDFASKICFIGGTNIRIVYASNRFSEDLDFDNFNLQEDEFFAAQDLLSNKLKLLGFQPSIETLSRHDTHHFKIKFEGLFHHYGLSNHANEKLYIKVDTQDQGIDYPLENKVIKNFGLFTNIKVPPKDILMSQKITALIERGRTKARDIYDLAFLSNLTSPNYDFLNFKLNIKSEKELKERLLEQAATLNMETLKKELIPFLFNQEDALILDSYTDFIKETKFC